MVVGLPRDHPLGTLDVLGRPVTVVHVSFAVRRFAWMDSARCFGYIMVDASIRLWRRGGEEDHRRAGVVGGSVFLFLLLAAGLAWLRVDQIIHLPYFVAISFLPMILVVAFDWAAISTGYPDWQMISVRARLLSVWQRSRQVPDFGDQLRRQVFIAHRARAAVVWALREGIAGPRPYSRYTASRDRNASNSLMEAWPTAPSSKRSVACSTPKAGHVDFVTRMPMHR